MTDNIIECHFDILCINLLHKTGSRSRIGFLHSNYENTDKSEINDKSRILVDKGDHLVIVRRIEKYNALFKHFLTEVLIIRELYSVNGRVRIIVFFLFFIGHISRVAVTEIDLHVFRTVLIGHDIYFAFLKIFLIFLVGYPFRLISRVLNCRNCRNTDKQCSCNYSDQSLTRLLFVLFILHLHHLNCCRIHRKMLYSRPFHQLQQAQKMFQEHPDFH